MVPSRCITPLPIGAPHSPQIIICPSGNVTSITTPISFKMLLHKIKNIPLKVNNQCCGVVAAKFTSEAVSTSLLLPPDLYRLINDSNFSAI